ncbi:MAG: preprotein translocase subunit SecE [Methylococcaceae bacterium]|nr:preprotein translocase subunit SecE [Methylotenera sp.]MDP2394146.1 preprotein translocase subunit SecE [Methylococcaceae bacterium]MDP3020811.1 preprotein translocase subunit SecE [Methylococcaceae bacterium]MDP3391271.1 preprotein translocase subunit SecE [Methylococcaceae bacterium]MDP3934399.1 preprotein translocase subunit SecE [Methylococcaceae bacterium]
MSMQINNEVSVSDLTKQIISVLFIILGLAGFYYYVNFLLVYRVIGLLIIVLGALYLLSTTFAGKKVLSFISESKIELNRVIWPTREETTRTTMLVFAMVFVVGFLLWLLDTFLFWGVRLLTGQGS